MTSNILISSLHTAEYCTADVPDLPDGKQHWSLAGTSLEREPGLASTETDATIYFKSVKSRDEIAGLTPEACTTLVLTDVEAAFRFWRDLYRAHVPCTINRTLWTWTFGFAAAFGEDDIRTGPVFLQLVRLDLYNFLHEVVCDIHFFNEAPVIILNVIQLIAYIILCVTHHAENTLDSDVAGIDSDTVNWMVGTVCRVSWEHRRRLRSRDPNENAITGTMLSVQYRLLFVLVGYYRHHTSEPEKRTQVDASVFVHLGHEDIRRMTLFLWFHHNEEEKEACLGDLPYKGEGLLRWIYETTQQLEADGPEIEAFALSDVLPEYGALAFLNRLSVSLQLPSLGNQSFNSILWIIRYVALLRDEYIGHFAPSGILGSLSDAFLHYEKKAESPRHCLGIVMRILFIYNEVATRIPIPEGRALLIRQYDVVGLLALAILYNVKSNFFESEMCRQFIDDYTAFSRVLCERHSKTNVLRKSLTQFARHHWYNTLRQLRASKATTRFDVLKGYHTLERSWIAFGEALGLNEEREAAEHEREKKRIAQFCAWKECQYHIVKPPSPPNACKGCGEVRYCGRECQIKDWKDGHKRVCKRLKDEAHAPKK